MIKSRYSGRRQYQKGLWVCEMQNFDFIVTTIRGFEDRAASELYELLSSLGDSGSKLRKAEPGGVLLLSADANSKLLDKVQETIKRQPWLLRTVQRIIPIQKTVPTEINSIVRASAELGKSIPKKESFRITVEKRHTNISREELIKKSASHIDRKVDLDNPDWILLIEIVGGVTGLSLLKPDDILSTEKFRREL